MRTCLPADDEQDSRPHEPLFAAGDDDGVDWELMTDVDVLPQPQPRAAAMVSSVVTDALLEPPSPSLSGRPQHVVLEFAIPTICLRTKWRYDAT
jgi:hypothetical protein